ncbi:DUF6223 family protein [Streptomyces yangpuensis]|uniref:DUF6223 family protein n=1 Tax=Streptomyces yangpuensis TaxID=1648182 RepID=UPI0006291D28|nr:DUF6223 family protein [Streptomyces yangpuensis]
MSVPSVLSVAATDATLHTVAADVYTVSLGRIGAIVSALTGLLGSVGGGLALARTTGRGRVLTWARRNGAVTALVAGSLAVAIGAAVAATAEGGLGTGNGLGGAYVAILLGLAAILLGSLARSRSRTRTGTA